MTNNLQNKLNQLKPQLLTAGQIVSTKPVTTISVISNDATAIDFGVPIILDTSYTGDLKGVKNVTSTTDKPYGVAVYTNFTENYQKGAKLQIAIRDTFITMEAGGTIAYGDTVAWDVANKKIIAHDGTNPDLGLALSAGASGTYIQVQLFIPSIN